MRVGGTRARVCFVLKQKLYYRGRFQLPLLLPAPPNCSEFIVSWIPLDGHREVHALAALPKGRYCLLTTWKCPRGGLSERFRDA